MYEHVVRSFPTRKWGVPHHALPPPGGALLLQGAERSLRNRERFHQQLCGQPSCSNATLCHRNSIYLDRTIKYLEIHWIKLRNPKVLGVSTDELPYKRTYYDYKKVYLNYKGVYNDIK